MKRRDFVSHLAEHDCHLLREGSRHSVFLNQKNGKVTTVPRHSEIKNSLARKICKDLDVPPPF
jgi:predicted RNA binding protein YcfA (HicA-like mRNA interferase family)